MLQSCLQTRLVRLALAAGCSLGFVLSAAESRGVSPIVEAPPSREAPSVMTRLDDRRFESEPLVTRGGAADVQLVSCQHCGQAANACICGGEFGNGHVGGGGGHGGAAAECNFTNLYWCNPYGDVFLDPCDRNACADCQFSSPPFLYASAELVPLARDQKDDLAFATVGAGGPVAMDTGDFKTEFDAGARIMLGATLSDLFRLEGSYLGNYEWSDRVAVRNQDDNGQGSFGNLFSPFSNFGTPVGFIGTDFNDFAQMEMTARFDSAELNLRRRLIIPRTPWPHGTEYCVATSWSLGVRYMNLDEQFGYLTNSTVPAGGSINLARIDTSNDLIGAQIGMLSQFLVRGHGWIDFEIKGGIYHNEATMQTAYQNQNSAGNVLTEFVGTESRDRTSFLGELSLVYNHQLTRHLSCRIGYNAFWLTGVALASQNLNTDIDLLALGPAQLDHNGELVLHGPTLGLTFAY